MALEPLIRGDYEVIEFTVSEPDPSNPGQKRVRNITSDTFRFTAKRKPADEVAFLEKATGGNGITLTTPTSGKGQIEILPEDTETITKETTLSCDLEGTAPSNRPYTTLF